MLMTEGRSVELEGRIRRRRSIAILGWLMRRLDIDIEPLICFRMKGIGYTHAYWGHGMWKGELAIEGESWREEDLDPLALDNQHIQQVVRARCGDQVGIGVLEQLAFGPYPRYGFTEFLDPA